MILKNYFVLIDTYKIYDIRKCDDEIVAKITLDFDSWDDTFATYEEALTYCNHLDSKDLNYLDYRYPIKIKKGRIYKVNDEFVGADTENDETEICILDENIFEFIKEIDTNIYPKKFIIPY